MKIILVNGIARSGKDTLIQELSRSFSFDRKYICETISTIDEVKRIARILGWNGQKDEKGRQFLANLKQLWTDFNNGANEYVVRKILEKDIEEQIFDKEFIYFIQCREPGGLIYFQETFDKRNIPCKSILVLRENIEIPNNEADQSVFNYNYDFYIQNNGSLNDYFSNISILKDKIKEMWNL